MTKPARQTASFLMKKFDEVGLEPDKRRGQNFLIDLNLIELLARTAELEPNDVVLEVGTGLGSLTALMAQQAGHVVTVEVDEHLHQLASEQLYGLDNLTMLHQDALRNKNNLHPNVLDAVAKAMALVPNARFKLAANLPYNIATPIISNLLATDIRPTTMAVTIQKELADRLVAKPRSKDYSALSIWVQSQADPSIARVMAPSVFWPRPKVHSAIVQIRVDEERRGQIPDIDYFHRFVRAMFFHRRKFLRSVILSAFKKQIDKPTVDAVMEEQGLKPDARAEQLSVDAMLALAESIRNRVPTSDLAN